MVYTVIACKSSQYRMLIRSLRLLRNARFLVLQSSSNYGLSCMPQMPKPNWPLVFSKTNASSDGKEAAASYDTYDAIKDEHLRKLQRNTKYGLAVMLAGFAGLATYIVVRWGAPQTDEVGHTVEDDLSHLPPIKQRIQRAWRECLLFVRFIKEPSREKLLPDKLAEPYYQPPITILIELNGILVAPEWTYQTGWRFKKRPAVEYFIQQVGYPNFELVFFTSETGFVAAPIIQNLDPNNVHMYRLFRDATKYMNGDHVKDLSCLNRDLSKVILIDWNPKSVRLQPENALLLSKWEGNDKETDLIELVELLKAIAESGVKDVREILQYYSSFNNPLEEFKRRKHLLMEEQAKTFGDYSQVGDYAHRFQR